MAQRSVMQTSMHHGQFHSETSLCYLPMFSTRFEISFVFLQELDWGFPWINKTLQLFNNQRARLRPACIPDVLSAGVAFNVFQGPLVYGTGNPYPQRTFHASPETSQLHHTQQHVDGKSPSCVCWVNKILGLAAIPDIVPDCSHSQRTESFC